MKRFVIPSLVLLAAVCAVYVRTVAFGYVNLDDPDYTFLCPFTRTGISWANVRTALAQLTYAAVWMPLTYVSYMLDVSLARLLPGVAAASVSHAVNVLLHALNALLVWRLLTRPAEESKAQSAHLPLLLALLWALHPMVVESVAWVAGRKELLWTTCALAGLLSARRSSPVGVGVFGLLASLAKPTAMCYPFLIAAFWPWRENTRRRSILLFAPLALLASVTAAIAAYSQTHAAGYDVQNLFTASFRWRLTNAVTSVGLYLAQALVPIGLHVDYRACPGTWPRGAALGISIFVLAGAGTFVLLRRTRACARPLLLFAAALLPTLGIFGSFGEQARADRFFYFPLIACALLLNQGNPVRARRLLPFVVPVLAVLTFRQTGFWRTDETLFSRVLACDADHGRALAHTGNILCARGAFDAGIERLRKSARLRPRFDTDAQLAYALAARGYPSDGVEIRTLGKYVLANPARDEKGQMLEALGWNALRERRYADARRLLKASVAAPRRFYSSAHAAELYARAEVFK